MTRSRAVDWAIGALGMLLVLTIAAIIMWLVISSPASDPIDTGSPSPVPSSEASGAPPSDLGRDEVWLGGVDVQSDIVVLPDSSLTDVEAVGYGARSGSEGLVIDQLEVRATVPFADVAAELGGDSRVSATGDGQAMIRRTVEVLGRQLTIEATGSVDARNGLLVVEPSSIDLGGPDVLSRAVAATVRRFVTIEQPIEGLPENLMLQDVTVQDDGFRATLAGRDVVLAEGSS